MNIDIYNEDCFEFLKKINDKSVNLFLIDPPYNIKIDEWDKWKKQEDYYEFMRKIFQEAHRVLKDNGTLLWFHSDRKQFFDLVQICKNEKFEHKSELIIYKENFHKQAWKNLKESNHLRTYFNVNEYCFHFVKDNELNKQSGTQKIKNDINRFINLRKYSSLLLNKIGKTLKEINQDFNHRKLEHFLYFNSTQFSLCTKESYYSLLEKYNLKINDVLDSCVVVREYEDLKNEYEKEFSLYQNEVEEYEKERYCFNVVLPEFKNIYHIKTNMSNNNQSKKEHKHSTPKNLNLIEDLIRVHSNENDLVLDCFLGTGTTAIAAQNTKRNFVGCEINQDYYSYILERLNK